MKKTQTFGKWFVEYNLSDGARLSRLCFDGFDLLTTVPDAFKPPAKDFGAYETRPVYGYDDCFPSVEKSLYPGSDWNIPDHGELCWLEWQVERKPAKLIFSTKSKLLPVVFQRTMHFQQTELTWLFKVINHGNKRFPFQHVMHPLLPLNEIIDIRFPEFEAVWSEESESVEIPDSKSLFEVLLQSNKRDVYMLYLQKVQMGQINWRYANELSVRMKFPIDLFPTLGVWWNNFGYPDENGCQRSECAFEPIAGRRSMLPVSYKESLCQFVDATAEESWKISWSVEQA